MSNILIFYKCLKFAEHSDGTLSKVELSPTHSKKISCKFLFTFFEVLTQVLYRSNDELTCAFKHTFF